jgi:hypothetical protein
LQIFLLGALTSLAVFVIPGYALTQLLLPRGLLCQTDRLCIACGVSLAIIPLQLLILTWLGIPSGPFSILATLLLALAAIASQYMARRHGPKRDFSLSQDEQGSRANGQCITETVPPVLISTDRTRNVKRLGHTIPLEEVLLAVVFVVTLALRLAVVEGVNYPPGGDGYHHTLISQIIHDTGLIPQSYRPYAPLDRFTYHFGFHSLVAAWVWLTQLPVPRSTVLVSQIINALTVPTLYIFTKTLTGRKEAGLFAAMVAGLVTVMPAYYVNWSRNTQLTANVMLPVVLVALTQVLEAQAAVRRRWCVLAIILLAGLSLAHYAIWLFAGIFILVYVAVWLLENHLKWRRLISLAGCALGAALLISPWLWHVTKEYLLPKHVQAVAVPLLNSEERKQIAAAFFAPVAWEWFFNYVLRPIQAVLAYLGSLTGMIMHPRATVILISWFGCLFILATPSWTGLPYAFALYNNFAVAIALYLAAAPLIALLLTFVTLLVSKIWPIARFFLLIGIVAIACFLAARWQPKLLNPDQVFVTSADEKAAIWISTRLPQNAKFVIRLFFTSPIEMAGVDGGYWLPYLTGREVSVPPMIYYAEGDPEYLSVVFEYLRAWRKMRTLTDLVNLMKSYGITYIYIGPRNPDNYRKILMDSGLFEVIYDVEGVTIFKLR